MSDLPLVASDDEGGERRTSLTRAGEHELARAAGFDTYDDFARWKREEPGEYERWYAELKRRAGEGS